MNKINGLSSKTPPEPCQDSDAIINITSGIGIVVFAALALLSAYKGYLYGAYAAAGAALLSTSPLIINSILSRRREEKIDKALEKAGQSLESPLTLAIKLGADKNARDLVLKDGSQVNDVDNCTSRKAALHCAVIEGNVEMVRFLLEHEAKPDLQDGNGKTPLHYAVSNTPNLQIIGLLLNNGADPDIRDEAKYRPCDYLAPGTQAYLLTLPPTQVSAF